MRLRHSESGEYASATRSGSREFHASSAIWTFPVAVSRVKGGTIRLESCVVGVMG